MPTASLDRTHAHRVGQILTTGTAGVIFTVIGCLIFPPLGIVIFGVFTVRTVRALRRERRRVVSRRPVDLLNAAKMKR